MELITAKSADMNFNFLPAIFSSEMRFFPRLFMGCLLDAEKKKKTSNFLKKAVDIWRQE